MGVNKRTPSDCVVCGPYSMSWPHDTEDQVWCSWAPNEWGMTPRTTKSFGFLFMP